MTISKECGMRIAAIRPPVWADCGATPHSHFHIPRLLKGIGIAFLLVGTTGLMAPVWGGVLKSLDQELEALVTSTKPYLVTVRGDGGWRNLVATGIVYDNEGHVITSAQILEATSFIVTFKDGRSYPALKVGADNFTGLAVLKIQDQQFSIPNWRAAKPLESGGWVTLVGNSYDTPSTVNFGSYHAKTEEGFLSLSLNASPGSSGGAVLNIDGDVVGVLVAREGIGGGLRSQLSLTSTAQPNALKFLEQMGGVYGRSYAVPFETARGVTDQIIQTGTVSRGYLGIGTRDIPADVREKYGIESGVMVSDVGDASPADSAGLHQGDIIISFDSHPVKNRSSLFYVVRSHKPGEEIGLGIIRDGQEMELTVRLAVAREDNLIGYLGGLSSSLDAAKDLSFKGLGSLESELARLRKELDRLQSQLGEMKKELRK